MADSSIEWTGKTWNVVTGCDKISRGCDNCYALTMAGRLKAMGSAKYQTDGDPRTSGPGFGVAMHDSALGEPLTWRKPQTVFVNSMSDLFHARVSREFLARVWAVMAQTPQHIYQILTKRPERMARIVGGLDGSGHPLLEATTDEDTARILYDTPWPLPNVWLGTSVESDEHVGRADHLRATPAAVRFVSAEPLLGPLGGIDLGGIDWCIIGGESGPGARPMDLGWVRSLLAACARSGTAPFVKQLGTAWEAKALDRRGKGNRIETWPYDLQVRRYPTPRTAGAVA